MIYSLTIKPSVHVFNLIIPDGRQLISELNSSVRWLLHLTLRKSIANHGFLKISATQSHQTEKMKTVTTLDESILLTLTFNVNMNKQEETRGNAAAEN